MPFYEQLLSETQSGKDYLLSAPIIDNVFNGRFSLETYLAFLHQAYNHVRHTAPLLETARKNLRQDQQWVAIALQDYIDEEAGHEVWILNDIEACGQSRQEWADKPPEFATEMMVAYLYDYVTRVNAMGIFGMVLVLEGTSASLAPAVAIKVQEKFGLPDAAMTYLTTHGLLDQEHIAHFEQVMDRVTAEDDKRAIVHVANRIYRLYGDVFRAIPAAAVSTAIAA